MKLKELYFKTLYLKALPSGEGWVGQLYLVTLPVTKNEI